MAFTDIDSAKTGEQSDVFIDYSVSSESLDSPQDKETTYDIERADEYLGYYKKIPELKMAIDAKATWTIGKGFESNPVTTLLLGTIKGFGKDTFNSIMENMIRNYHIYGDAFAEIVRSGDQLVNLKPLDPGTMRIVADQKGMVKRYEQRSGQDVKKFRPEQIFHLCRNRVGDEIHGVSIIEAVEEIILMRNEAMQDYKKLLHRNIYPVNIWQLDTDVPSQISSIKTKVANAKHDGEDIFIPKGTVEHDLATNPSNRMLNPQPWIQLLNQYFYQAVGVPQIIIGGSNELTQTAAQIAYLAFEQTIEEEQLYVEEQTLSQLNLEIALTFPASLQNNLLSDDRKDGTQEQQLKKPSTLKPSFGAGGNI